MHCPHETDAGVGGVGIEMGATRTVLRLLAVDPGCGPGSQPRRRDDGVGEPLLGRRKFKGNMVREESL